MVILVDFPRKRGDVHFTREYDTTLNMLNHIFFGRFCNSVRFFLIAFLSQVFKTEIKKSIAWLHILRSRQR